MVDHNSRFFYALLAAAVVTKTILFYVTGLSANSHTASDLVIIFAFFSIPGLMLRRVGDARLGTAIEAIFILLVTGLVSVQLQFPMATFSNGFIDDQLLAADNALGFDWLAFSSLFASRGARAVLEFCYGAFRPEAFFVILYLCARKLEAEVWRFLTAYLLALLIAVSSLVFAAATGKFVLCGLRPPEFPVQGAFCDYGDMIQALSDGRLRVVEPAGFIGLASMPSFHACAAILMQWYLRHARFLRLPALLVNIGMIIGAIVVGSHYLVDIIAGLLLAIGCICVTQRLSARNDR